MSFNLRFYATVNSTASFSFVVSNWAGFAVADRLNAGRLNTVLLGQNLLNGVCTTLGQFLVVSVRTDGVSVTFNSGVSGWVLLHEVSQVLDVSVAVWLDDRLVEVELHVQLYTNNFSNCWAAISVNSYVGWGVRALVNVVANAIVVAVGADFSRSWNWSSSWLAAATEVHTQTNRWSVVPTAVVQFVVSFYASTGEEVFSEVVLNASASSQESRLVATGVAVSSYVGQVAVLNTTFNVRTQSVASVVEVVLSGQTEVVTAQFLATGTVVRTGVVVTIPAEVDRDVVGQEVTDFGAWLKPSST